MIYLDSAATTMQKPKEVSQAVSQTINHVESAGRGDSLASMSAAAIMLSCRELAAKLFGVSGPERVIFTFNATHGLNIAIKSIVKPGSKVVISGYEHNAVSRPLQAIPGISVRIIDTPLFCPEIFLEHMEKEIRNGTDAVICTHVSNVFGYILPVEELGELCVKRGVPFISDASQSAGVIPINMESMGAEFIAMPGHKALYGPQGTVFYFAKE